VSEIPGLNKMYCPQHIRAYAKEYKIDEKKKQVQSRLALKEENRKKKELEKTEKAEKKIKKKKETNKVVVGTNVINEFVPEGTNNDVTTAVSSGCSAILKTGLRKGQTCDTKVFNDNLCKRHCCK
jgi:predicted RND superfamily exporter protein